MAVRVSDVQDTQTLDQQAQAYGPLLDLEGVPLEAKEGPMAGIQQCIVCELVKPVGMFYLEQRRGAGGRLYMGARTKCKACWRLPNTDEAILRRREEVQKQMRGWQYMYRTRAGHLFDHAFASKLHDIATTLYHHNIRDVEAVKEVSDTRLSELMTAAEVTLLRHSIARKDTDVLYFLFDQPLHLPEGQPVNGNGTAVAEAPGAQTAVAEAEPERETVLSAVAEPMPTQAEPTAPEPPLDTGFDMRRVEALAQQATVSDDDIETAADMIVTARERKRELQAAIDEIEDQLRSLREQMAEAEQERQAAISLLRRA